MRGKGSVVGVGQTVRNTLIPRKNQADRGDTCGVASGSSRLWKLNGQSASWGKCARIDRRALPGVEGLHFLADVGQRRGPLPTHTVIQRPGPLDLPAILRQEVQRLSAHQFLL